MFNGLYKIILTIVIKEMSRFEFQTPSNWPLEKKDWHAFYILTGDPVPYSSLNLELGTIAIKVI